MEINWKTSKFFKEEYLVIGEWNFEKAYKCAHVKYIGADTETKLYYKDKLLTEDEAYNLLKTKKLQWCKANIEVKAYAFMMADAENFALFKNAEDFLTACSMLNVEFVYWYNARFDFAIFDYFFLTNGWNDVTLRIKENSKQYRKMPDKTYQSLNGEFGQRYQMQVWKSYVNRRDQKKVHKFKMVDICNIFGGGLKKNLKDWDIRDRQGNPVRKLEMDYVEADIEDDIQYMINDTKGLYLLSERIDETMSQITGYSLFKGDFMTAGGLAKKTLLKFMFGKSDKENIKLFKKCFPITLEEDIDFRNLHGYCGGKCFVNPRYIGVVQKWIHKHDINSMYPSVMYEMLWPFGLPKRIKRMPKKLKKNHCYLLCISNLSGTLRPKAVPVYQDSITHDYVDTIMDFDVKYMWYEELEELENWYFLDYDVEFVLDYEGKRPKGVKKFIDTFYTIKSTSKGAVKQGAKLELNSSYGKIAQKIEREMCTYELDPETGAVHIVKHGTEIDEKTMLNVKIGSRITALARVKLMKFMREICDGDPSTNFIYCDTDSIHSLTKYDKCDPKTLGLMDYEGFYKYGLYLAPKSYLIYNDEGYEVHCKGVNTSVVAKELEGKNFLQATKIFRPNRKFKCLCGLNVKGGKALIYADKFIVNDEYMVIDPNGIEELFEE